VGRKSSFTAVFSAGSDIGNDPLGGFNNVTFIVGESLS
jgi:hypothetical protein